jgi:DNA topoisomerase-1
VGHLFTISQNVKGTDYPIFDIGWYPNSEVKRGRDFTKKYSDLIKRLVKGASEIVIATDFDVEGEVIGYNVMRFIANQADAKRMKFSSLTPKELQDSFDNRQPSIEWGQAIAGETRHFLDWLYGINLSRALMSAIKTTGKFSVMSIGRVQGPALNLIVEKEKQIQAFKPKPYWQVFALISDGKNKLELKHNKDITKKPELDKFEKLKGKKAIAQTIKTKQIINPPAPFDLTSLQTEAYKLHGITPSNTLQVAQKLYLAGLISYPRTSSQKIPEAIKPLKIIQQLSKNFDETQYVTRKKPVEGNKSDPAHPAITPTGIYKALEDYDEKIYNLVVKRFISCFCDNAELANKKVEAVVDKLKFVERGLGIIKPGWMKVYPAKMNEKEIPDFDGEVDIENIRIEEKETKPPKRYTPASIVSELEKRNLGTKATRANILETLYDRKYIKEKSIKATQLGINLIDSLKKYSPIIIDEKLTREVEKEMANIRSSKKDLEQKEKTTLKKAEHALTKISADFKENESKIGQELRNSIEKAWEQEKEDNKLMPCPSCKKGFLTIKFTPRFKSYFVACTEYPECKQTFSLPSNSLIKKADKECEECKFPMLIRIKAGKRPWVFCFNPNCPSRQPLDINGNTKKPYRYTGQKTEKKEEKPMESVK